MIIDGCIFDESKIGHCALIITYMFFDFIDASTNKHAIYDF